MTRRVFRLKTRGIRGSISVFFPTRQRSCLHTAGAVPTGTQPRLGLHHPGGMIRHFGFYGTLAACPPEGKGRKAGIGQLPGFDAPGMSKDRSFPIFAALSFLICIPLGFNFRPPAVFLFSPKALDNSLNSSRRFWRENNAVIQINTAFSLPLPSCPGILRRKWNNLRWQRTHDGHFTILICKSCTMIIRRLTFRRCRRNF